MPAVTVGAKSISCHFPTPPGVFWVRPPTCFMKWFLTHVGTVALGTIFSTLTAAAGAMLGVQVPTTRQPTGELPPQDNGNFWQNVQAQLASMNWMTLFKSLLPPVILPVAEANISMGSPTVTVNGAPLAYIGPLTSGSCSDLPMVPNANTMGFSNVMVGITVKEMLMQFAWNAINGITGILASKAASRAAGCVTGEPIDICTGAVVEDPIDFIIPGPIPFEWVRHYTNVFLKNDSMGWCWTHEYHRYLDINEKHIKYHDEEGRIIQFPRLTESDPVFENKRENMIFRRISEEEYELQRGNAPLMVFNVNTFAPKAMMTEMHTLTGSSMKFIYDKQLHLVSIIDSGNRTYSLKYDNSGRITSIRCVKDSYENDVNIFLIGYEYDKRGDLVAVIDAAGSREQYKYGDEHRMTRRTNKLDYSFHYEYNKSGQCVKSYGDDDLYHVELEYLPSVNMTRVTEPLGGLYIYRFNENSLVTQIIDPYGHGQMFSYDKESNPEAFVDENGDMTMYEYDSSHHKTLETNPNLQEASWKYDNCGRELGKTDTAGNSTSKKYDEKGNCIEEKAPDSSVTYYEYDSLGRKITAIYPDDSILRYKYGPHSLPIALLDGDYNVIEEYEYDALGNCTAVIADGKTTSLHYDSTRRLINVEYPDGTKEKQSYDVEDNILSYTNRLGYTWHSKFGSWNKLLEEIDPQGNKTRYSYNKWDTVDSIIDPNKNMLTFLHDQCNRCTDIKENGNVKESFEYEPAGNVIKCCGPDGKPTLQFIRGKGGQVEKEVLADGKEIVYTYNETGKMASAQSTDFEQEREYDSNGRVAVERYNGNETKFTYSKCGIQESTNFSEEIKIKRFFDAENNELVITDPLGHEHRLQYNNEQCVNRTTSWGLSEKKDIDDEGRIITNKITATNNYYKDTLRTRSYDYNAEDELTQLNDSRLGYRFYGYDRASRLVEISEGSHVSELRYHYDAAGNLMRLPDGRSTKIQQGNRLVHAGNTKYRYDKYGYLYEKSIRNVSTRYYYNSAGLLIRVVHPDATETEYTYDSFRRRIAKKHNGTTTHFLWEQDRLVGERINNSWQRIYIYGRKEDIVPCAFADLKKNGNTWDGESFAIHTDHIETPFAVSDSKGFIVWEVEFLPYGEVRQVYKNDISFYLRFPGQYFDEETELHYNRHRYYDPELGRYITPDPIGVSGGINLYAFPNNPFKEIDFLGLHGNPKKTQEKGRRKGAKKGKSSNEDLNNEVAVKKRKKSPNPKNKQKKADSKSSEESAKKPIKRTESDAAGEHPPAVKKVEYGDPPTSTYWVDSKGRTTRAEGELNPPDTYKKEGVSHIRPEGYESGRDHRGHLIPERSALDQDSVNVNENVIPEHGRKSNLSTKKLWENKVKEHAERHPGCKSVHEPIYKGDDKRPVAVKHDLIDSDGKPVPGFSKIIENPT